MLWDDLEREAKKHTSARTLCKRISSTMIADLFAGVTATNAWALMLQLPQLPATKIHFTTKGLQQSFITLPDGSKDAYYLQLAVTHSAYNDLFLAVAKDIAESLEPIKEKARAFQVFTQRLAFWQEFLAKFGFRGLSDTEQQGLLGELWFLNERISPSLGNLEALRSWKGPQRRPRDFQANDAAIEIKTTTGKQHIAIRISNENQLDDAGLSILALCHMQLEHSDAGGLSLPELVKQLRERFTKEGLVAEFDAKIHQSGYLDVHEELYAENRYRVVSENYYRVRPGFPRIVSKDLPLGVGDIRYSIAAAALSEFKTSRDEVFSHLKSNG